MTGFVDLRTGNIYGVKTGSRCWWHEKAHIIYNDSSKGMRNNFNLQSYVQLCFISIIFALFFPLIKFVSLALFFIILYYYVYEEAWCWLYAFGKVSSEELE